MVPQRLRPGWKNKEGIDYYAKSFASFEALAGDVEYRATKAAGFVQDALAGTVKTAWPLRWDDTAYPILNLL